jgi:hypothetical protein
MKRTLPIFLSLVLIFGFFSVNAFAAEEVPVGGDRVGVAVIDIGESAITPLTVTRAVSGSTKSLAKDMASSSGTGTIYSIGQFVDFSGLPSNATIKSITLYTPTSVRVTQSPYTAILNWHVQAPSGGTSAIIKFLTTNSPGSQSKSTVLAGNLARGKYFLKIEGRILSNQSGFDGFTVFGGSQMIVEYDY